MYAAFFIALLMLSGCATLTASSQQTIAVSTAPAGAQCHLSNSAGSWEIPSTPASVDVTRSYSRLNIRCHKDGKHATQNINAVVRDRAVWNALLGPAGAVDAYTGAGYEYPVTRMPITLE